MRIVTVNLNGIRSAAQKGFFTWVLQQQFDVICLQETRAHLNSVHAHHKEFFPDDYHCYYFDAQKPGYSGVGILCKQKPLQVVTEPDFHIFHHEGRYLQIDYANLSFISLYLPSGSSGEIRQQIKFDCLAHYLSLLKKQIKQTREYIICGDWNIAHKPIDLKNWRANQKNSGFLPEERAWLSTVFDEVGYVDAFRLINQQPDQYTWWSNRGRAYENNVGWRIDYQIISPNLSPYVQNTEIYKAQRFSDHAPLIIEYAEKMRTLM